MSTSYRPLAPELPSADWLGTERYELRRKHAESFSAKSVLDLEIPALDVAPLAKTNL